MTDALSELVTTLSRDRFLAHRFFFPHRHGDATPDFHREIIRDWNAPHPRIVTKAFRGGGKTTLEEEHLCLDMLFGLFRYGVVLGNTYSAAVQRITVVKHEIENNERIREIFGGQVGPTWKEGEIVLSSGAKLQAFGVGQSMRGAKHLDARPDFLAGDDIEDEDNAGTDEARDKLFQYLIRTVFPALAPQSRIRLVGTPLHPKSALERLSQDPTWFSRTYPIRRPDGSPQWEARFPRAAIDILESGFIASGEHTVFMQEYMCQAESPESKPFKDGMVQILTSFPRFAPVTVFVDPARTTNVRTSARTGYAAWSWIGSRLYVHEAFGAFHAPDEIVDTIFAMNERHQPIEIGVEPDGLEEFLMQPLRAKMVERGISLPLRPIRAPRGKMDFIRGLQPFAKAREIYALQGKCDDLLQEMTAFPSGRIDVVNAAAYATRMRPGLPVYRDLSEQSVMALDVLRRPTYLAINALPGQTAAVLVQWDKGRINIVQSWLIEEAPVACLQNLLIESQLVVGREKRQVLVPVDQTAEWKHTGLMYQLQQMKVVVHRGAHTSASRGCLGPLLRQTVLGVPAIRIDPDRARSVVNGFAGGYAREFDRQNSPSSAPVQNGYKLVMEALESWYEWVSKIGDADTDIPEYMWSTTGSGRQYISTLAK